MATDHEIGHGRDIRWTLRAKEAPEHIKADWHGTSWIAEVIATGIRDGKPFKATHRFITSLRTTPEALLRLVRERWSLESWHWIRDTQLREDDHRYRGKTITATAATVPASWRPCAPLVSICCAWPVSTRSARACKR